MRLTGLFHLALILAVIPVCLGIEKDKASKPVHDVAITDISVPSNCNQGNTIPITISLANQGTRREAFTVRLINQTSGKDIASKEVVLAKGWKDGSDPFADLIFTRKNPDKEMFGKYVAAGDVNGDGYDDLLITATCYDGLKGSACLYYGGPDMDNIADKVFIGKTEKELLGEGNYLGDVNGDNYQDVILGACCYNSNQGRVYIYYGGPKMDTIADVTIVGEKKGVLFGRRIVAHDIDRDGYDDVLIVANLYNNNTGRAYLFYGGDPFDTTADVVFDGEYPIDRFGRQATMGPDVNGDGYGEILIGARAWPGGEGQGRAYLYFGNTPERMDNICDKIFTGEEASGQLGATQGIFDIDKDGFADVLVCARFAANYRGQVYVYWGSKNFNGSKPDVVLEGDGRSPIGGDKIVCGYFNDDNYGDILTGCTQGMRGRAYIYYGDRKNTMDTICDKVFIEEDRSHFGIDVAAGDVNGDGFDDAVMGAYSFNNNQGKAYLFYGPFEKESDITFNWDTTNTQPGKHTLKATIAPVAGEEDTADNTVTVTVEVKEK